MRWSTLHSEIAGGALITAGVSLGLSSSAGFEPGTPALALAAYLVVSAILFAKLGGRSTMGWPSRVTLSRAAGACALAGALVQPEVFLERSWLVVALVLLLLALDGLDGWLARRLDESTAFGARFDMETDATLIVVLCAALWVSGLAPIWVMVIGLMRPAFVAAGWVLPWLASELPQSFRRKLVCVIQVAVLPAALLPVFPQELRIVALALALLALIYSFGVDAVWLFRHRDTDNAWRTT